MQVKKQQLEPYMEKLTGQKLRKDYNKVVYCHVTHLTCMQCTSGEMLDWMSYKLESSLLGEISTTIDMQIYHSNGRKQERTKEPLIKMKEESEKACLKVNI